MSEPWTSPIRLSFLVECSQPFPHILSFLQLNPFSRIANVRRFHHISSRPAFTQHATGTDNGVRTDVSYLLRPFDGFWEQSIWLYNFVYQTPFLGSVGIDDFARESEF